MWEVLSGILEAYLEWRTQPVEILLGIGPLAAVGIGLGGSLLSSLLNRPSGQERALTQAGTEAAQADAERTRARNRREADVEALIRELAAGGAPPVFNLMSGEGGASTDINEFMAQIAPRAELNAMLQLLGASAGSTGAAQGGLAAGLGMQQQRNAQSQAMMDNLLFALINGDLFGGGGNSGGGVGEGGSVNPNLRS